ncbi:MAG: tRNA (guanine-N7)-methyltransferase, partial [Planctomycetota bacterium]
VVGGDAREVLAKLLLPGSVAVAHVYFPDPWWKRKHAKRRLFTDTFVDLLDRVLGPAGEVSVRTDVPEYFERVRGLMDHDKRFSRLFVTREELSPEEVATSFERKAREQNTVIDCGRWRRA